MKRTAVAFIVVLSVLAVAPMTGIAHSEHDTDPAIEFRLQEDGDAEVLLRFTYDLNSTSEQQTFEELRNNQNFQEQLTNTTESSLRATVEAGNQRVDRNMSIENTTVSLETVNNSTGIVEVETTWINFASVENDTISLSEPLASGFEPDRKVVVYVPDGYELTTVSPEPTATQEAVDEEGFSQRVVWEAGTTFDGFELELSQATQSPDLPGFGVAVGVIVLVAVSVGLYSRREQ